MATTTADLTIFKWEGRDKRGVKLKGEQVARTQNLVRADLRRQGITPVRVYKKPKPLFGGAGRRGVAEVHGRARQLRAGEVLWGRSSPREAC